jgi:hypothetical protein
MLATSLQLWPYSGAATVLPRWHTEAPIAFLQPKGDAPAPAGLRLGRWYRQGRILQVPPHASLPNPKSEARNPKEIRSPKPERLLTSEAACPLFYLFLRTSDFELLSGFGPRVSDFWADGAGGADRMHPTGKIRPALACQRFPLSPSCAHACLLGTRDDGSSCDAPTASGRASGA